MLQYKVKYIKILKKKLPIIHFWENHKTELRILKEWFNE